MPPVDEKVAAAERAANEERERAAAQRAGAQEGAQSVAEAVKRVADAAVAEVQKSKTVPGQDFLFTGTAGGRFAVRGKGFGPSGTLKIGGHQALTDEWGNERIAGKVPEQVKAGDVVVEVLVDSSTTQRGTFRIA